ncbi:glycosyltransferase family A protein [Altibacter lentus]|uniref:glycosyltransferase family A protein n=1 Tax=Altibacter lentus TaxID=1223410 RepID=UPI000551DF5B|nr:glycosyltransferase family A protein [Altibacter lentus]
MRVGLNPVKDQQEAAASYYHQVVVPVYIPDEEGYFEHSVTILKYCLESLFRTAHAHTFITVVNNGSHDGVSEYLETLRRQEQIHELIHTHNIGKINAVFKGLTGHRFPLVTITDADVLFLNGWQEATYAVFEEFPKTGCVTTTPNPKLLKYHTAGIMGQYLFSSKLRFVPPRDPEALTHFAESIGTPDFFKPCHKSFVLRLEGKETHAVLGAGHFVATYRGHLLTEQSGAYSEFKLGGLSVRQYLDQPVADQGYWRLATETNYTYHMGNVAESWMQERLRQLTDDSKKEVAEPELRTSQRGRGMRLGRWLVEKLLQRKPLWTWFLQHKGLSKSDAKCYAN